MTERELPVATELAGVNMCLEPGAMSELHWHKQAEWAYMLAGRGWITAIDPDGRTFADDIGVGDLWYFPAGIPHSIQGLQEGCEFLLVFDDGGFSENGTFLISDWLAHTPPEVLSANLGAARGRAAGPVSAGSPAIACRPATGAADIRPVRPNEFQGNDRGLFGFFECVDDPEVAGARLDTAEAWLRERDCGMMVGPMDLNTNPETRLLVEGHDHGAQILESWHHPYLGPLPAWDSR